MPGVSRIGRGRLALGAALAIVCATPFGLGAASAGTTRMQVDSISVTYVGSSSMSLRGPSGSNVAAGGSIPAGTYQVLVYDDDYQSPRFQITGPGVNVTDDLNSTGMGVDHPAYLGPYTFQANSSYTVRDTNFGASFAFSTTSASSSGGGSTTGGGSSTVSGSGSSGGTKTGSGSTASGTSFRGTIKGSVSATGSPALSFGGKAVKTLKKGRYTVSVSDKSKKAGLVLGMSSTAMMMNAITVSKAATVGTSSKTVTLAAGKWYYATSAGGKKTFFTVTS